MELSPSEALKAASDNLVIQLNNLQTTSIRDTMSVPEWVQDAIFYQIFPDRFANGNPDNDPPNVMKWGAPPTSWGFQGGDLSGILQKFDYLLDLGINAIYLKPHFSGDLKSSL